MSDVSLREYIERIIQENNTRRDDLRNEDQRWIKQELEATNKALLLQATEYERRLTALNHEGHRIAKAVEVTVSRDTWDGFQKQFVELKDQVLVELSDRRSGLKAWASVLSIASLAVSILTVIVIYLKP